MLRRPLQVTLLAVAVVLSIAPAHAAAVATCDGLAATIEGTDAGEPLTGTAGVDVIAGLGGNDDIQGLAGNDVICGGAGRDSIYYDGAPQAPSGSTVSVNLGSNQVIATDGTDRVFEVERARGSPFADSLIGSPNDDTLIGAAGDDAINGLGGDDQLYGFAGADSILGGAGTDTVNYDEMNAGVTVDLSLGRAVTSTMVVDTLGEIEQVYGTHFNDVLIGDGGPNQIFASEGDDVLRGGGGGDKLYGGGEGPGGQLQPDADADTIYGEDGNDQVLNGNEGADTIFGGPGRDGLIGEAGADALDGGADFDYANYGCYYTSPFCVDYAATGTGVSVDLATGSVGGGQGNDQLTTIEGVMGSDFADTLVGSDLTGDYFWPRRGNDTVDGRGDASGYGDMIDFVCSACPTTGVTIDLSQGQTGGSQGADTLIGIEHAVGSEGPDTIIGDDGANDLFGQQGNDTISGGGGDDGIAGETGNDTLEGGAGDGDRLNYTLVDCSDGVGVDVNLAGGTALGDGQDTIVGSSFEQVIGTPCADSLSGSPRPDTLYGSGGADQLLGRGGDDLLVPHFTATGSIDGSAGNGADRVFGGSGDDTVSYSGAQAGVVADIASGVVTTDGDGSSDQILGVEAIEGSGHDDNLAGSAASNLLLGGGGDDQLLGRGGNDYLDGEAGNDGVDGGSGRADFVDYVGYQALTASTVLATAAGAGSDRLSRVEGVAGTPGDDSIVGDAAANFLIGEGGYDVLVGRGADDLLIGSGALAGGAGDKDWCFTSGLKTCEIKKDPATKTGSPRIKPYLDFLARRDFRLLGVGQLQELESALDAMRKYRNEDPT